MKELKKYNNDIGASLVEYGLLLTLIALIAIPSVSATGWVTYVRNCEAAGRISGPIPPHGELGDEFFDDAARIGAYDIEKRKNYKTAMTLIYGC